MSLQGLPVNLLYVWISVALVLMAVQLFVTPGYGRHVSRRWGPAVPNRFGWVCMELVSLAALWWALLGSGVAALDGSAAVVWLAVALWSSHYVYRSLVYPLRTRTRGKSLPLVIMLSAVAFNVVNGYANGVYLAAGEVQGGVPRLTDVRTLVGVALFVMGWAMNFRSDNVLLKLRSADDQGYHIPRGGLFNYVSCPNFLGEIIAWCGFAVLCWNLPALAFAVWTAANLIPRALAHHRWYKQEFADYPSARRALIPGVL